MKDTTILLFALLMSLSGCGKIDSARQSFYDRQAAKEQEKYENQLADAGITNCVIGVWYDFAGGGAIRVERVAGAELFEAPADLTPLKGMKLTDLYVFEAEASDLGPLKGMPLKSLFIFGSAVADLTPLKGMKLEELDIGRTRVSDLTPLKGMPLKTLDLFDTDVSDLTPLRGMLIESLDISQTKVCDLAPLVGMPLEALHISETSVSDLTPLKGMKLISLDISKTSVSDLAPLEGLGLQSLTFTPRNITNGLDVLRRMTSLTVIGTDWNSHIASTNFWDRYDVDGSRESPED